MGRRRKIETIKPFVDPSVCIFCGGGNLTKEHIFPDWLRQYVPRTAVRTDHRVNRDRQAPFGTDRFTPGKLANNGDLASRKLRVVCGDCNSGWMSRLQSAAKPLLIPFVMGEWVATTPDQARIIAAWATMFSMVWEYADPESATIRQQQRTLFFEQSDEERSPPTLEWAVFIGQQETFANDVAHSGIRFLPPHAFAAEPRVSINTIAMGRLILHIVFLTMWSGLLAPDYCADLDLRPLWPKTELHPRPRLINNAMWLKILTELRSEVLAIGEN